MARTLEGVEMSAYLLSAGRIQYVIRPRGSYGWKPDDP